MWDCESPTLYGNAGITSAYGHTMQSVSGSSSSAGGAEVMGAFYQPPETANSLANFCTNITETDDALKQVRGGGFLAEFEQEDLGEEEDRRSCSTAEDVSPLGEARMRPSRTCMDDLLNGEDTPGLWVR